MKSICEILSICQLVINNVRTKNIDIATTTARMNAPMSSSQGKIFTSGNVIEDKYVVLDFIGKGAFGEVYRVHQLNLQRDVALKVVSQDWLRALEVDDEEIEIALQRFRREVQAMARVRHTNVLQIYDNGATVLQKNGRDYPVEFIVMEYIPGATLRHAMSEEGFYPEQAHAHILHGCRVDADEITSYNISSRPAEKLLQLRPFAVDFI